MDNSLYALHYFKVQSACFIELVNQYTRSYVIDEDLQLHIYTEIVHKSLIDRRM